MKSKTAEAFNLSATDYGNWFKSPDGQLHFSAEVKAVRLVMKKGLTPPFLEIGVGTGVFASVLSIPFGIDPAFNMLHIAKMRGISVALAKGENLPFRNGTFGAVFMLLSFCFVENPIEVLKEIKRVLLNDGKLVLCFINKNSKWGALYKKKKGEGHHIYSKATFFSYSDVVKFIDKINLRIIKCSSTLLQHPSEKPNLETPVERFLPDAGFICISAER